MKFKEAIFTSLKNRKRQNVINSHLKYVKLIKNYNDKSSFEEFIYYFIKNNKSLRYCKSVYVSLVHYFRQKDALFKKPFSYSKISSCYKKASKIQNSLKNNDSLYHQGLFVNVQHENINVNMGVDNFLPINEIIYIKNILEFYLFENFSEKIQINENIRENFYILKNKINLFCTIPFSIFILSLIYTGARNGEFLLLTHNQGVELTQKTKLKIITKTGPEYLSIGNKLQYIYYLYIKYLDNKNIKNERFFKHNYYNMRRKFINLYTLLFNKNKPRGALFHIFRSFFTLMTFKKDNLLTQDILHHKNVQITNGYYRNQLKDVSLRKKLFDYIENIV
ncbi:hypothetical protein LbFV_ORF2 [Leptopilina boulardi filamentous virus]|uniref:Integrase n=1 Tax=Leptopilina boulardi filamentous virus TaxID=552509 RepID=A0A1S5YD24_9VIRU|nr:hypothetical protein LbFV_ORF2 [Leptopilina boulardi filamentous virus]AQQ79922.1 hypothetical protein LbFV_ORF2 [Leptopilina boulardi filamentous virus]